MEGEQDQIVAAADKPSVWTSVTELSKSLALLLFIILPFVGAWVGYQLAPEKIVYTKKTITVEVPRVENTENQEAVAAAELADELAAETAKQELLLSDMEAASFGECMENGGEDLTYDYNSQKRCQLDNRIYQSPCIHTDDFLVVQPRTYPEFTEILVKPKADPEDHAVCRYVVEEENGDFTISVTENSFLFGTVDNYLLIDSGTGPGPRGLDVYDLDLGGVRTYGDVYLRPVTIAGTVVDYWTTTDIDPTPENCERFDEWRLDGLGAGIDERVSVNLATLDFVEFGEQRCTARQ